MTARGGKAVTLSRKGILYSIIAFVAFLIALNLYSISSPYNLTLAHGGSDGAELAVAVQVLGIPHPTGYPTYVLIAQAFRALPGWTRTLAGRLNAFSSLAAALTAGLVAAIAAELLSSEDHPAPAWVAGLTAGLSLAVAGLFWSQAIIAEVYALHTFFLALCCWLLLRWRRRGGIYLPLAGLSLGLGLGNHVSLAFLLPGAVLFVIMVHRARPGQAFSASPHPQPPPLSTSWRGEGVGGEERRAGLAPTHRHIRWGEGLATLLLLLAGLAVYLYLPLRAAADPWLNWGNPRDWGAFWAHVGGQSYRGYLFQVPWDQALGRLSAVAGYLWRDLAPWGLALGLGGLFLLGRRDRPTLLLLAFPAGLGLVLAITYGGAASEVHLLPLYVAWALAGGVAAGVLAAWLGRRFRRWGSWAMLLVPLLSVVLVILGWPQWARRDDPGPLPQQAAVLAALPPGSLLLTDQDEQTFPLWYAQVVDGTRPDVAVVDVRLLEWPWYRRQLPTRYPGLSVPAAVPGQGWLQALLEANPGRAAGTLGPLFLPSGYGLRYQEPGYWAVTRP
jgi:hypothetical protein